MGIVLRAFLLFAVLLALALLLGQAGSVPVPVSLQLGSLTVQTTAPVAITLGLALLLLAFYFGRLTGWFARLPRHWRNRKKLEVAEKLADAHAALALGNTTLAHQLVTDLKPDSAPHADLIHLIHLRAPTLPPLPAQNLSNPRLAALTALTYARAATVNGDWAEVRRLTTLGRQFAPENAHLLTLQFKALVNMNDPAASELLPSLKPLLGPTRHKLLTQIISGPNALAGRPVLDSRWTKAFEQWLPTQSDVFPAE